VATAFYSLSKNERTNNLFRKERHAPVQEDQD
jgi:hypothetical protein